MSLRRTVNVSLVLLLIAWLVLAVTAPPPPTHLRRYVGAPQRDGRRYTFLYPDRLHLKPQADGSLVLGRPLELGEWLAEFVKAPGRWSDGRSEAVEVKTLPYDPSGRSGWRRTPVVRRPDSSFRQFQAVCNDPGTGRRDLFVYSWRQSQERVCAEISVDLVQSFQVLGPGEVPPVDSSEESPAEPTL